MSYITPFNLLIIYLFFEYGRPQAFFPIINYLRPGIIIIAVLIIILLRSNRLLYFESIKTPQTLSFLLLLVLMFFHIPIATNNYWALQIFKNTFALFVIYLTIISYLDTFEKITKFVFCWILINAFCALNGIMHGGMVPGSAFMGDENDFALVMNMTIPIAFFMFLISNSGTKKTFLAFSILLCSLASVASLSRGGFIGLVIVGCYCWIKSKKKVTSAIIVSVLVFIIALFAPQTYWDEVKSITEENVSSGTGYARWYMWQRGWDMFLDNFVIGVGQGNYPYNIAQYEPEDISVYWRSHAGRPAHSLYITLLSELGVVGAFLYYRMISKPYMGIRRRLAVLINMQSKYNGEQISQDTTHHYILYYRYLFFGMTGALVGYLVTGIFLSVLYYPHLYIIIALLGALKNIVDNTEGINSPKEVTWRTCSA